MKIIQNSRRAAYGVAALLVGLGVALPEFAGSAFAASGAQVQDRSITMSSSAPSATTVTYEVKFTPQTTEANGEVIVDFCSNSPIPGDSCTADVAGGGVPDLSGVGGTNVSAVGASNIHTAKVTGLTLNSGSAITIDLTGIKNPTATASFYARIFTYATGGAASYVPANGSAPTETGSVDYGGIALSTAAVINVTAKVMETLSFCVYQTTCGDDPSFQIGAGPNGTLNTTLATATTNFDVATNAKSGVSVKLKGDTLTNGAYSFATPSTVTPTAIAANAEGFGLAVTTPGSLTATSPYNGTATTFALDTTSVKSTYGQEIAKSTAPVQSSTSTITWGAQASNTTPAGIYTAAEQLIATGTY